MMLQVTKLKRKYFVILALMYLMIIFFQTSGVVNV